MAATTISAILERFQTVLEAPPLNLVASSDPFTDTAIPNTMIDAAYRVTAGGVVRDDSTSNYQAVRVDRVVVTVYQTLKMDAYAAQRDLQTLLDSIERAVIADGPDHSYFVDVEKGSRKTERPKGTDLCRASIAFLCDYDFDQSAE